MRRLSFACGRRRTFSLLQAAGCMSPGTNAGCSPAVFCWLTVGALLLLLFRWWIAGEINKLDDARIKIEKIVAFYDQNTAKKFQNGFDLDDGLIIYNRVPKTGSTSFVGIAYDLCDKNRFNVLHLNVSKNNHILSLADQARFVQNTTTWLARKPALYHGHIAYLEFSRKAGSEWALEKAKHNLINNYLVVGITDELSDFVAVLETVLPRYFSGASDHYNFGNRSHLRQTFNKMLPSHETVLKIKQSLVWKMEQEFYQFAREQFHFIKQRIFTSKNGHTDAKKQQFVYEKIRPR